MANILWAITGAGTYMRSLPRIFLVFKKLFKFNITIAFSRWGYEVARIYGVLPLVESIASGEYLNELLFEDQGMYYVGRLNLGKYDLVVIAPATSNTIAKMVYGIADTLPTTIFSEAQKSHVTTIVLPVDLPSKDGVIISQTPCYIDRRKCNCLDTIGYCPAAKHCPVDAILIRDGPRIDLSKCIGCEKCISHCINNAIHCWREILLYPRKTDLDNINKLRLYENTIIVSNPLQLAIAILDVLGRK